MFVILKVISHGGQLLGSLILIYTNENKKEGEEIWFEHPSGGISLGKIVTIPNKIEQKKLKIAKIQE